METESILLIMLPAFVECLVLVGIHSYLGIHVIKRKVIFVDLAFAQIAALGTLVAFLFGIQPHTPEAYAFAIFLCAIGAAVFSLCRFRRSRIPQEAIIGLVYAISAALAILLIDKAPHGAEHLKEILTGSILWVTWDSILLAAVVYAGVGLFHYLARRRFLLISEDPEGAWEAGWNVRFWDFLFYLSFGIVITLSVDVAGVLIVFVFLVAPAILAMAITDRLRFQLLLGWTLGVVVTVLGLLLAYLKDLSTGPAVIAVYGAVMVVAAAALYVARAPRRTTALRNAMLAAAAFAAAIAFLFWMGDSLGERHRSALAQHKEPPAMDPPDDAGTRAEDILAAIEADGAPGVARGIEFLLQDPPPYFRELVMRAIADAMDADPGFAPEEGLRTPTNRSALDRVRAYFGLPNRKENGK